jgi:lipoprotein-anchoring transpeptidase ErfK/SrfK
MGGRRTVRARAVLAAAFALVPLVPIVIGALFISGGSGSTRAAGFTPASRSAATAKPAAPRASAGAVVAVVVHPTAMRLTPGGKVLARITTRTEFGSPEALWVRQQQPGWLGVVTPLAGNRRIGWIPRSAASLSAVSWELRVSLSARRLTVIDRGRVLKRYLIAIGRPDAPTPSGRFAVTDRLLTGDPAGPYGCCILALSAHSPHAIQGWTGGDRIAIHSTPDAATIGEAVSHGCMRVTMDNGRWLLAHIPLGTPTLITS